MGDFLRPEAILFDWDNTLVDSWQVIHDALTEMFVAMGHEPWSFAETKARTRHSLRDSFPALFGDSWERAKTIYLQSFEAIHLERLRPIDGAQALLERLAGAGTYLAVVSNKTGRLLRLEVEALGWQHLFGNIVGAGDAVQDKPNRAPVDLALADSGIVAGERVWFVGDTTLDMQTAVNSGCIPVLLALGDVVEKDEDDLSTPTHRFEGWASFSRSFFPLADLEREEILRR